MQLKRHWILYECYKKLFPSIFGKSNFNNQLVRYLLCRDSQFFNSIEEIINIGSHGKNY